MAIKLMLTCVLTVCCFAVEGYSLERPVDDFPIAELQYRNKTKIQYLYNDYGFIVKWEEDEKPKFYIYNKPRNTITTTRELAVFLTGIEEFPDGATVAWVNRCGGPFHTGMPENMLSDIKHFQEKKNFRMATPDENNFSICVCETRALTLYEEAQTLQGKYSFSVGESGNQIDEGTVWLYHHSHYGLEKYAMAEIIDGKVHINISQETLEQDIKPHVNTSGYIIVLQFPDNLWYRTPDIAPEELFIKGISYLDGLGDVVIGDSGEKHLVLPAYSERKITFVDQNDTPVVDKVIPVSIFVAIVGHCGIHAEPIELGTYKTDAAGTITFIAPLVPLYLDIKFLALERKPGFAGQMYSYCSGLETSDKAEERIKLVWEIPEEEYSINVKDVNGVPIEGLWIELCRRVSECGAHYGGVGQTGSNGNVSFAVAPQTIKYLAVCLDKDNKYYLTEEELVELINNKTISVTLKE